MPKWQNCLVCKLYCSKAIFFKLSLKYPWFGHIAGASTPSSSTRSSLEHGCITCLHQAVMMI